MGEGAGNTAHPESIAPLDVATTAFQPLTPCRLVDTRGGAIQPGVGTTLTVPVRGRCGVDLEATAVAVTITVTEAAGSGYITAWPSGTSMPLASTNNYEPGETRANGALLALGVEGDLAVFSSQAAQVIVDVSGQFHPTVSTSSGRYVPMTPFRAVDTRQLGAQLSPGGAVTMPLPDGVPADATAMAVTLTTTQGSAAGYVTAYAAGSVQPLASVLNTDRANQTRTSTQIIPVSVSGLTVFSSAGGHIIVDVAGYFTGDSASDLPDGLFVPAVPSRVLDTRGSVSVRAGKTVVASVSGVTGNHAAAVAANITVTQSGPAGYLTAWAAQTPQPGTPAVSYDRRGSTVANLNLASVSTAGMSIASTSGTHAIVDITGWFTGSPSPTSVAADVGLVPAVQPNAPVGCLQYVPAPQPDGLYLITPGMYQTVAHIFDAGPNGPIVVVGDSLTVGSAAATARALRAAGWGPICVDGTVARSVEYGSASIPSGLDAVRRIKSSDKVWNDPTITWVVALGTNDVDFSLGSQVRADHYIADQMAAIGPNPIWWMNVHTIRPDFQYPEALFNQAIVGAGAFVIDWYSASVGQPWFAGDRTHLVAAGYQARAVLVATTVRP